MRGPRQRRFEAIWKPIFERECPLLYDENDESIYGNDADNIGAMSEEERYSQASPADHTHSEVGAVETTVSPTTMHERFSLLDVRSIISYIAAAANDLKVQRLLPQVLLMNTRFATKNLLTHAQETIP